jgi:DNA-binding XRE family transcriptional regulator
MQRASPVNDKFAARMASMNYTDATLAEKAGCDRSMIAKIRAGHATPSLRLASKLIALTGLSADDMIAPTKEESK